MARNDHITDPSVDDGRYWAHANFVLVGVCAVNVALLLLECGFVAWKTRSISSSRRFPLLFFNLCQVGYILLIIEAGIYIYDPDLAYVYYIWILYVIGRPLSFLPVMILASRLKIIYTGYFDLLLWRRVSVQCVRINLGEKWMIVRLVILMVPCLAFYPLICVFGAKADLAYVAWQCLYMAMFLYMEISLVRSRKIMQPHDFKQAIIMFVFWGMMVVNIGFANFGWYLLQHVNSTTITNIVTVGTLNIQCLMVFMLWVINFRIVRAREVLSKPDNPTHETLAVSSLMGKDNDALDQDLAAEEYSTHTEI